MKNSNNLGRPQNPKKWVHQIFSLFSWGKGEEAERLLAERLEQAIEQFPNDPKLSYLLERAAKQGKHTAKLNLELSRQIKEGRSKEELEEWIEIQKRSGQREWTIKYLKSQLKKHLYDLDNQKAKIKAKKDFILNIQQLPFENDLHPQNLRNLALSDKWDIYIDETGINFDSQTIDLQESHHLIGRIIALAIPHYSTLEQQNKATHSADLDYSQIQNIINTISKSKNTVGILGATLENDLRSSNWMSSIGQLARWTTLMLPLAEKGSNRVRFFIENRELYNKDVSLQALQDSLVSNLKQLLPERFKELHLTLEFMDKTNPYNGYVDAIANLWGSRDALKKKILKETQWLGHCLLQSNGSLGYVERLYRDISQGSNIDGSEWFELCYYATEEGENSLLAQLLKQIGTKVDKATWRSYLAEAQYRVSTKNFNSKSLNLALEWLNQHKPRHDTLPKTLQLPLLSSSLASDNHLGKVDPDKILEVAGLIKDLEDEDAVSGCNAILRIAIATTNNLDFDSITPYINEWIKKPIAVPGLLNHAKLHSTLGQLNAFKGNYPLAIEQLDTALGFFGRLSDPEQIKRESQQSKSYRLFALLEAQPQKAKEEIRSHLQKNNSTSWLPLIRGLARSQSSRRFEHHLLLRYLITFDELKEEQQAYIESFEDWHDGDGEGHPWMLINAYRAWLLYQNHKLDESNYFFQLAIENCFAHEESNILIWMGYCLQALQHSLKGNTNAVVKIEKNLPDTFPVEQLPTLVKATSNAERLNALNAVLPFNFH